MEGKTLHQFETIKLEVIVMEFRIEIHDFRNNKTKLHLDNIVFISEIISVSLSVISYVNTDLTNMMSRCILYASLKTDGT